ncbi:MAG: hypothetical protein ACTTH8_00215 [Treponema sp.]
MKQKMKRWLAVCGMLLCAVLAFAHTPLLTVEDNGDGTIFVQGGFSNGSSAGGVKLYLTSVASGEKLWEGVFPEIGELDVEIPNEPYTVTFDAGPGHVVVKEGPPPPGGFGAAASANAAPAEKSEASKQEAAPEAVSAAAVSGQSIQWTAQDTAAVMPSAGVSYISLFIALVSCINLILLFILVRRKH